MRAGVRGSLQVSLQHGRSEIRRDYFLEVHLLAYFAFGLDLLLASIEAMAARKR